MFCTNCGNQLNEGARFCGKCGAKVEDYIAAEAPAVSPEVFEDTSEITVATAPVEQDTVFEDVSKLPEEQPIVVETVQESVVEEIIPETIEVVQEATPVAAEEPVIENIVSPIPEVAVDVAPVEATAPQEEAVVSQPASEAPAPLSQYQSESAAVSSRLKKSLGSVVAIIAAVIYLITIGIKVIGAVTVGQSLNISDVVGAFSIDMADSAVWLNVAVYAVLFIGLIPMLLIVFGLIFNIVQSYRKNAFCSAGFTTIRIAEITKLVINSIIFAGAAFGVVFALVLFDGFIDDLAKQFNEANVTVNLEPLTNGVKWIILAVCGFIALWKAMEIAQNAVILFGARKIKQAVSEGCAKERRFIGLRTFNYILVFFNGIILSIQIVCLILSEKITDFVGETVTDLGMFTSSDASTLKDLAENLCRASLWGLIATALLICVYLMYNANLSNFVQKDEQIEIQK